MSEICGLFSKKIDNDKKVVTDLSAISTDNIKTAFSILDKLNRDQKYMTRLSQQTQFKGKTREEIQNEISEAVEKIVSDSRVILSEMDSFLESIIKNETPKRSKNPFLRQVWDGEVYGDLGYAGLFCLRKEILEANNVLRGNESDMVIFFEKNKKSNIVQIQKVEETHLVKVEETPVVKIETPVEKETIKTTKEELKENAH